jgi:hypothetical protein
VVLLVEVLQLLEARIQETKPPSTVAAVAMVCLWNGRGRGDHSRENQVTVRTITSPALPMIRV